MERIPYRRVRIKGTNVEKSIPEAKWEANRDLYADTRKGRRPSWQDAAPGALAEPLVDEVVGELRRRGATVATGVFGAKMQVSSVNEGPMTLLLEV